MTELIGLLLPPIIDLINKHIGKEKIKFVVSFLVCMVVGVAMNFNDLNTESIGDLLGSISVVFASAQASYKLYWEKSSIREKIL